MSACMWAAFVCLFGCLILNAARAQGATLGFRYPHDPPHTSTSRFHVLKPTRCIRYRHPSLPCHRSSTAEFHKQVRNSPPPPSAARVDPELGLGLGLGLRVGRVLVVATLHLLLLVSQIPFPASAITPNEGLEPSYRTSPPILADTLLDDMDEEEEPDLNEDEIPGPEWGEIQQTFEVIPDKNTDSFAKRDEVEAGSQRAGETDWDLDPQLSEEDNIEAVAKNFAVASLVVGLCILASAVDQRQREVPVPLMYDVEAITSWASARPEMVIGRFLELFTEFVQLFLVVWFDGLRDTILLADVETLKRRKQERAILLREVLTRCGPAFIKLGQALASRPDFVGEETCLELIKLQDKLPFFDNQVARNRIKEELGAYPEYIFDSWSKTPVAAASLGQVYKARVNGMYVAVKVQRPDMCQKLAMDFYLVRTFARLVQGLAALGWTVRTDLVRVVDEYACRLFEEVDYITEIRNTERFRQIYGNIPGLYIPRVFKEFSTRRVITTEWIEGTKVIDDTSLQVKPEDLRLLEVGIKCTLTQLLDKGFLHADPHGGNLIKTMHKPPRLAYLDFGLVSEIPRSIINSIICAIVHLINGNFERLAMDFPGLALMSEADLERDLPLLTEALKATFEPSLKESHSRGDTIPKVKFAFFLEELVNIAQTFKLEVPPYFLSNVRALGELEGLAKAADPNFDLLTVVYPYVVKRLFTDPSPRLRVALNDLILDADGNMKWDFIDRLLKEAQESMDDHYFNPLKKRNDLSSFNIVLDFICAPEGAFLRTLILKQLINDANCELLKVVDTLERRTLPTFLGLPDPAQVASLMQSENLRCTPAALQSRDRVRNILTRFRGNGLKFFFRHFPLIARLSFRFASSVSYTLLRRLAFDLGLAMRRISRVFTRGSGSRRSTQQISSRPRRIRSNIIEFTMASNTTDVPAMNLA